MTHGSRQTVVLQPIYSAPPTPRLGLESFLFLPIPLNLLLKSNNAFTPDSQDRSDRHLGMHELPITILDI